MLSSTSNHLYIKKANHRLAFKRGWGGGITIPSALSGFGWFKHHQIKDLGFIIEPLVLGLEYRLK
jgi:hypothetical protein